MKFLEWLKVLKDACSIAIVPTGYPLEPKHLEKWKAIMDINLKELDRIEVELNKPNKSDKKLKEDLQYISMSVNAICNLLVSRHSELENDDYHNVIEKIALLRGKL